MAISTNQKPTIYRNFIVTENMDRGLLWADFIYLSPGKNHNTMDTYWEFDNNDMPYAIDNEDMPS